MESGSKPCAVRNLGEQVCDLSCTKFKRILHKYSFLDKTLFIKDIFDSHEPCVFITAPFGSGRSTIMDMMKEFLSCELQINGEPIVNREDGQVYRLFQQRSLDIYKKTGDFFKNHCGKYPVIYADFASVEGQNLYDFKNSWKKVICDTFAAHSYLIEQRSGQYCWRSNRLSQSTFCPEDFVFHMNPKSVYFDEVLAKGWAKLSKILEIHYGSKVVFLIDNYDLPIWNAATAVSKWDEDDLNWLKNCFVLLKAQFSEVSSVEKCLVYSFLGSFAEESRAGPSLVRHRYTQTFGTYFGVTDSEFQRLLQKPIFASLNLDIEEVKIWYGGYVRMFDVESNIFHLLPLLSFLRKSVEYGKPVFGIDIPKSVIKQNWVRILHKQFLVDSIKRLINGEELTAREFPLPHGNVSDLCKMWANNCSFMNYHEERLFFQFLVDYGLLVMKIDDNYDKKTLVHYRIPNMNLRKFMAMSFRKI